MTHSTVQPARQTFRVQQLHTFFCQEQEAGFLFPGESHSMPELIYVDEGPLHSVADGLDLVLQPGELVLYRPEQWRMQYADVGVTPRFLRISFEVCGLDLSGLYDQVLQLPPCSAHLAQQLLQEVAGQDDWSVDMIHALLAQLLLTLMRGPHAPQPRPAQHELAIICAAQQYIAAHAGQKLSVPIAARNAKVSPSYLTALFQKHLQISPGEYIRRVKLQQSKQLILDGSMSFTEIAAALQYSTIHHFSRQFKEKFGMTPSEYAKSVR